MFSLLQLLAKFNFPPSTTKPGIPPPELCKQSILAPLVVLVGCFDRVSLWDPHVSDARRTGGTDGGRKAVCFAPVVAARQQEVGKVGRHARLQCASW